MSAATVRRAHAEAAVTAFTAELESFKRYGGIPLDVALYGALGYALRMHVFASTPPAEAKAIAMALKTARHDAEVAALRPAEQVGAGA